MLMTCLLGEMHLPRAPRAKATVQKTAISSVDVVMSHHLQKTNCTKDAYEYIEDDVKFQGNPKNPDQKEDSLL